MFRQKMYNIQAELQETKFLSTDVKLVLINLLFLQEVSCWEINKIWKCINKNLKLKLCICVVKIIGFTINVLDNFSYRYNFW